MTNSILIVDDDSDFLQLLSLQIKSWGYVVTALNAPEQLASTIAEHDYSLVLLDMRLGTVSGLDVMTLIQKSHPQTPIVMMSAHGETEDVVRAMKAGAADYILKTESGDAFRKKINQVVGNRQASGEDESSETPFVGKLVSGQSERMRRLLREITQVAQSDATIFLRGESGTGKSLIAELVHALSARRDKPFVTINCSAIPSALIESELFGHVKGAFTGAIADKPGKFEYADGGTIFLDEIGELNSDMQVKILRVLQSQEFERVGALKTQKADVRILAATNRDIERAIAEGAFREDLFYRLNVLPLYVPPLRERREDIPGLIDHFIKLYSKKMNKVFMHLPEAILRDLQNYDWPGNVRELQNVVERAVILAQPPHLHVSDFVLQVKPVALNVSHQTTTTPTIGSIQDLEYRNLMQAIEESRGNMSRTAEILGVCRDTLYRRLKKYGIQTKTQKSITDSP